MRWLEERRHPPQSLVDAGIPLRPQLEEAVHDHRPCRSSPPIDVLFVIDDSCSMSDDQVALESIGDKRRSRLGREGEMKDRHSRQTELLAQRHHIGGDLAEILGNQGKFPQRSFDGVETVYGLGYRYTEESA